MADPLRLLFELDVDSRSGTAGLLRFRKEIASTVEATRRAVSQPLQSLNTTNTTAATKSSIVAANKGILDSQREVNRQIGAMWAAREKDQSMSLKKQSDTDRAFAAKQISNAQQVEKQIAQAFRGRDSQLAKAEKQSLKESEDALAKYQASRLNAIRKAEKEGEAAVKASNAAKDKAAKQSSDNFVKLQKQTAAAAVKANKQATADKIRAFKDEERAAIASGKAQERAAQQAARAVATAFRGIGPGLQSLGRTLSIGITAPLVALGAASLKSAKDLDANVNTLKAFTGSAEAAERRLAELIKTARGTPGLTTNLALTLDAQLRTAKVVQETIDRVLPAIGRLNAVSKLPDVGRFTQNLVQLVTQNFEKQDLKELVGQSPIAGQLITEIFNVDSPTNAKAIRESAKRLGINSVDAFFKAFSDAAQRNQGLASVTESIGTRFDKLVDRVQLALRPLGLAIINAIEPFVEPVAQLIERLAGSFNALPESLKAFTVVAGGVAAALGPVLFLIGGLLQSVGQIVPALVTLNAIGLLPTLTNLRLIGQVMIGTASLAAGATATAVVAAAGWIALAAALGLAAFAIYRLVTAEKELAKVSTEQVKSTSNEVKSLHEQLTFINGLRGGVASTATEQEKLRRIYASLNPEARARVDSIKDETGRLGELRTELQRLLTLRTEEQRIQAATLSANLAQTVRQADDTEAAIERSTQRINELSRAREALERNARPLSRAQIEALRLPDLFGQTQDQQLQLLERRIQSLIKLQGELRSEADKLNGTAREQSETLKALAEQTGLSERQILVQARAMGLLKTDVDAALQSINAFRAEQGQLATSTATGTERIDEQTESLKALKRALKEAEIATQARSAATRRAFEDDKITSSEATARLINDARELAAAQIKEIDAGLQARRSELEGADADTAEKLRDEIGDLELKRTQILSETGTQIEDLRAEQRRREREGETEHQSTLIEIRRASAETQIDDLRDRIEREESFRLNGERQIVLIERRVTQEEETEIRRRLDLVATGTEERRRLEDELTKFVADKARQRAEQARRLAKAELDTALLPVRRQGLHEGAESAGDAGVISRLRSLADEGRAGIEATERQIGAIIDNGFARKIKRLKDEITIRQQHNQDVSELNAELRTLEQERQNAAEETDRAIERGREDDLDRARSYRERLASIYGGIAEVIFELRGRVIDALRRGLAPERQIIDEENKLAVAREQLRHTEVAGEIQGNIDRLEALQKKRELNAQELKELRAHREALKAENDLNKSNQEEIERQRKTDIERADPTSGRSLLGDVFADTAEKTGSTLEGLAVTAGSIFADLSAQAGNFATILTSVFSQLGEAVGTVVENFIKFGNAGVGFKKFAVDVIASVAKMAIVKSVFEFAEAAAMYALFWFTGNPKFAKSGSEHLLAGAAYALVGGVAAGIGRATAGSSFRDNQGSASAAVNGGDAEPRNRTFAGTSNAVESSMRAAQDGSGGSGGSIIGRLFARVESLQQQNMDMQRQQMLLQGQTAQALSRIQSMPHGQALAIGASENPAAVGRAVLNHSNSDGDFNEQLQRNLGFA